MKIMEIFTQKKVSRRSVLKAMSATAAAATIPGCGGSGGKAYEGTDQNLVPPEITGSYVLGAAPHNCGGGCVSKFYVENGIVKRIVTDEDRDDGDVFAGKSQIRSCARCRSKADWWYRNDRLTKPLKQTKQRGDITGFVEISWDQAVTEIAAKMKNIYATYGGTSIFNLLAPSDRSDQSNNIARLTRLFGADSGTVPWVLDFSYGQHTYSYFFVDHDGLVNRPTATCVALRSANYRSDVVNSDNLVLWGYNPAETRAGAQTAWFVTNAREKGVNVTVIDPRYTRTAEAMADDYVGITAGTDAALMLSMLYYMIVNTWDENGNLMANPMLDEAFIRKYVHGFFDDTSPKHYYADIAANPTAYQVPAGASLSAYILGTDDRLTKAAMSAAAAAYTGMPAGTKINQATSVYPKTIGYNVNDSDALYNKVAPMYGQTPKTPEWASAITGVRVAKIQALATMYATKKVTTWVGGSIQRHTEGEQPVNLGPILAAVTKNFGQAGRSYGFPFEVEYKYPGTMSDKVALNGGAANGASISGDTYDFSKLTLQGGELGPYAGNTARYSPTGVAATMNGIAITVWPDYVRNAGKTGKSKWNYSRSINSTKPVKGLICFGGNFMSHSPNLKDITDLLTTKGSNGTYDIELVLTGDMFFTASSALSDYVLPCAGPGEKWGETCGWLTAEAVVMPKITDPPGEAKNEFEIARLIAAKLGLEGTYKTVGDGTGTVVNSDYEWSKYNWNQGYAAGQIDQDWDAIQKVGGVNMWDQRASKVKVIAKQKYYQDPAANPLNTLSGKIEAYCQAMTEDYEASKMNNIDTRTTDADGTASLYNGGRIYTASTAASAANRRFVYPIPMYIPPWKGSMPMGPILTCSAGRQPGIPSGNRSTIICIGHTRP
ncbi:molybdopterin-dependent oxidoreductase [Geobacter sp. FeAm09]|uniref:molybdopterin-dependent oxidoreductase n=1 Tax=Geobacter sp. FeAm09 TaxID=2597769 RepID=UPI0011EC9317|nr:molybdopterin-dependent oxidoreductase [Geobacter sp. FeAm09]QEM70141.1 molybdopterin-dependent oxidoreductase [Geobacter sp. FeAm09]